MKLKPYTVLQFLDDVRHEFQFLIDDYGFEEPSTHWVNHTRDLGLNEHVTSAAPVLEYTASMRHVSIAHDPRGAVEVIVQRDFPDYSSTPLEELVKEVGAEDAARYGEIYDMTLTTAGERIPVLAAGLKRYGRPWLEEPEEP